jgi:hypothetical protein
VRESGRVVDIACYAREQGKEMTSGGYVITERFRTHRSVGGVEGDAVSDSMQESANQQQGCRESD